MKKLTGFIALVLLLSVSLFLLGSCGGGGNESKATSQTSTADSKAESVATSAEESEEESVEESAEESKVDIFTYDIDRTKTKTNVALNKTYTFEAGTPDSYYPDEESKTLTDGVIGEEVAYTNAVWVGVQDASPTIVIDLGEVVEGIADFDVHMLYQPQPTIKVPLNLVAYVSEDGVTYYETGALTLSEEEIAGVEITETTPDPFASFAMTLELEKGVKAQYVKFEIEKENWLFMSEFEISTYE